MWVISVRSMTIRFERGIRSLTSFLRMAATSAVNLPLHSTTVASSFTPTRSLKRDGGESVGFIRQGLYHGTWETQEASFKVAVESSSLAANLAARVNIFCNFLRSST